MEFGDGKRVKFVHKTNIWSLEVKRARKLNGKKIFWERNIWSAEEKKTEKEKEENILWQVRVSLATALGDVSFVEAFW